MPPEQIQTLSRAVAILDCFSLEQPEWGVREIARKVQLSSSATGRLLAAMKDLGILSQNPQTRAYSMGARALSWAGMYTATLDVRNQALPAMEDLHHSTQETISLYILDGNERVCVERMESLQNVRIVARLGRRLPLHAGAAGKVMLAFLSVPRQNDFFRTAQLQPLTSHTLVEPAQLRAELAKIHEAGVAVSYGEWIDDAAGVAAPILDDTGQAIAALTISGPILRFDAERVNVYCREVKRVAGQISENMGYRRGQLTIGE